MDCEVTKKLVIPVENGANNISFCSADGAKNVVAVGGASKIGIKSFQFQVSSRELCTISVLPWYNGGVGRMPYNLCMSQNI